MTLSRRRFLTLTSAACLTATAPAHAFRWQGMALGARTQIILDHPEAEEIARAARNEIARLERMFSLYKADSELSRLNRAGVLEAPSFELLDCLAMARRVHDLTGGRFDPTVQPLWAALAEGVTDPDQLAAARAAVGFDRVRFDSAAVRLDAGQALTLNGIAQGYIADRVAVQMRAAGVRDVLVDTGEIIAMGARADGSDWPVRIAGTELRPRLRNRALATSASLGTVLDGDGRQGHILSPDGTRGAARVVSVSARSAALADALSTGLCLVTHAGEAAGIAARAKARLEHFA